MLAERTFTAPGGLSTRQRRVRRRAGGLCFEAAVRLAVDRLFDFTHSTPNGKALWSEIAGVWMGRVTFVNWAMGDDRIDIPRIVAKTDGAPEDTEALHKAVNLELKAYWKERLGSLPPKSTPNWLPLP